MMTLCCEVIHRLYGKTLATAESCTGGGIGAHLTSVPGASAVFRGGVISYCNEIKEKILGVDPRSLSNFGAVSEPVARQMASGVRSLMSADIAVSVTGLAGPGGDEFGNPVGTVYIGYADANCNISRKHFFQGSRDEIRQQTIEAACRLILEMQE